MVIHYARDAPISDMDLDYVQAKAARENLKQAGKFDTSLKNIKNVVETMVQDMRDELRALTDNITSAGSRAIPDYVISRNTRKIHRI